MAMYPGASGLVSMANRSSRRTARNPAKLEVSQGVGGVIVHLALCCFPSAGFPSAGFPSAGFPSATVFSLATAFLSVT